jgi:hypothetical protein
MSIYSKQPYLPRAAATLSREAGADMAVSTAWGLTPRPTQGIVLPADTPAEALNMISTILIVLLVLMLLGSLPAWPYSTSWGYGPGGIIGLVLVIIVILVLLGRI